MGDTLNGNKIAIIDGNSLLFRAFFAIRNPMITSRGVYTHAIFGFLNMMDKALKDIEPDYIAVAFDRKSPTFRHLEYDAYKAGRAKTPDELHMQFPYLKEILAAMNIKVLEMDGYEADDLIGTLAKRAETAGLRPIIISGDRDELQLVSDKTSVMITKKGVSEFELYTPEKFHEKYGFGPELFIDYKGLMGDASDNIPGLPGVGEKTAAKLVQEFGSIENIVEHVSEVSPERIRKIIEENEQTAHMSKMLATIVTNAPIETEFEDMRLREWDIPRLKDVYTELEFKSFLRKLENIAPSVRATPVVHTAPEIAFQPESVEITMVTEVSELEALREKIEKSGEIVLHILGTDEHVEQPVIYAIYIYVNKEYFCILTRDHGKLLLAAAEMLASLELNLIGCGLKDDLFKIRRILAFAGKAPAPADLQYHTIFDLSIADYLLAPGGSEPTFAQLALTYGGISVREGPDLSKNILAFDTDDIAEYGRDFCVCVAELLPVLRSRLADEGMDKIFDEIEMPLVSTLAEIEVNGFAYNPGAMSEISKAIDSRIDELTQSITELAGETFNINSPKQLGDILFDKLGLPGGKKNKNGYSTSIDVLSKLQDDYPIVEQVLEYRMLTKLKGTYIDGLPAFVSDDRKIRPHLMQTIAATGRLSCVDPNLQNIPIRKEPGRQIRKAFVPESDDYVLMGADYSQIELRLLAHLSGDPSMIEDFKSGADIHRRTAARVFGVADEDEVSSAQRSGAKAVNFGIVYGMSSFGLSEELSISRKDAEKYIAEYFKNHPAVKDYLDESVAEVRMKGYSTTLWGRRRAIPEIKASQYNIRQFGERLAMNSPLQGSAADIIKIAMNRVYAALKAERLETTLILQVHDELILQVKKGEEKEAERILRDEMVGAAQLSVPLDVDIKVGATWYELK